MAIKKHPKPDVQRAIVYAVSKGWRVEVGGAHAWGKLYCPYNSEECRGRDFCIVSIWSTPRNAFNHARQIHRVVDKCTANRKSDL